MVARLQARDSDTGETFSGDSSDSSDSSTSDSTASPRKKEDEEPVEGQTNAAFTPEVSQGMLDTSGTNKTSGTVGSKTSEATGTDKGVAGTVSASPATVPATPASTPAKLAPYTPTEMSINNVAPTVSPITAVTAATPTTSATEAVSKVTPQLGFLQNTKAATTGTAPTGTQFTPAEVGALSNQAQGVTAQAEATPGFTQQVQQAQKENVASGMSLDLLKQIQAQATGQATTPSPAQLQLQQATEANIAAQQAAAANQRGQFNPALLRAINAQASQARQTEAGQAAVLRAQEQQQAQQTAASLGTTLSAQNISAVQKNQEIGNALNTTNAQQKNATFATVLQDNTQRLIAANKNQLDAATSQADRDQQIITLGLQAQAQAAQTLEQGMIQAGMKDAEIQANLAEFNAKQQQDAAVASTELYLKAQQGDQQASLQLQQMKEAAKQFAANQGVTAADFEQKWAIAQGTWQNNIDTGKIAHPDPGIFDYVSVLLNAGGAIAAATSDKYAKRNIKNSKVLSFLDHIEPKSYEYKDGMGPSGKRYGFLAQDLEKSPEGKSVVIEDKTGVKKIDTAQSTLLMMAALAEMNKKLKKLEGK